ncbi:Asp23/Gls24 family envelope stress response protein [Saccharomonospora piscinae]|uniref:Asp23/Gls24 family envelope stress response protein n=1 Tax=Saccharomonospora piscinae TaxID=687388 RepID=UPI0004647F46|nr:Asp23/Gls24 family envelope stress response protein [Saccharomonospora piscinae]
MSQTQGSTSEQTVRSRAGERSARDPLSTDEGRISVSQSVVTKIAGVACREVGGVHDMGTSGGRAVGALRERIPGSSGPSVSQGVAVEVGETQAAIDLDIVVEYGISIADLGKSVQRNVKQTVERMTGLEVTEININVDDVYLPDEGQETAPRVS